MSQEAMGRPEIQVCVFVALAVVGVEILSARISVLINRTEKCVSVIIKHITGESRSPKRAIGG
jgi:hypothetical protein